LHALSSKTAKHWPNDAYSTKELLMACTIKPFTAVMYGFSKKLECLSLAGLSSLAQCLQARPGPYTQTLDLTG
jgi:hypothetical protein